MAYIAPERFRDPRSFDARCDIYSLGVLLWELTSGHAAFARAPQDVQLVVSILNGRRENPIEGTPKMYQRLYERCWNTDPKMRPSLNEILSTLATIQETLSEDQLAMMARSDEDTDFEESVSIPRPTSEYHTVI
ncbi:Nuclear receptor sub 2 group C member 2 [Mortierella sp. AD011]|nr:Nuclear receptor sub 2 group C member 2 [Mortierella sp. AD011]